MVEYTIVASSQREAFQAMMAAHDEIERVSSLLWEEDPKSEIRRLNEASGEVELSPEVYEFLARSLEYYRQTSGRFDLSIGPVLKLYPFDSEEPVPPSPAEIQAKLAFVGMDRLQFVAPGRVARPDSLLLAVGGVAKGYAVDRAIEVLRSHGIEGAIVNAGGDLYCLGTNNGRLWVVGIQHPDDPNAVIDTLHVSDGAVATSGDYQRFFEYDGVRYHHVIDPSNGLPARLSRSATVLAPTTEQADALATALFIAGPEAGLAMLDSLENVSGMVVGLDLQKYPSQNYPSP